MKKKIAILVIFYLVISIAVLSPYISSYAVIKYLNNYVITPIGFSVKSWSYYIQFALENSKSNDEIIKRGVLVGFIGALVPFILPILIAIFAGLIYVIKKEKKSIHGNARLANDSDLSKSGFFPKEEKAPAILIGKMFKGRYKGQFLKYCGQQFLMLFAPTRSGKGVGIVIPNCLYYKDSMVVLDIKLENFLFSAGYRQKKMNQKVFLFCPEGLKENKDSNEYKTHRYNPLFYINRDLIQRTTDLSKISSILFPKTGGENDMWTDLSENLFQGLVLFLLDCENEKDEKGNYKFKVTMSGVSKLSSPADGTPLGEFLANEIQNRNSEENLKAWEDYSNGGSKKPELNRLDDETVRKLSSFTNQAERQQGNILLQFIAEMKIFNNPVTAQATDGNDFDFREIRREKTTIYYGLSPDGLGVYKKLTNLFFSQLIGQNVGIGMLPSQDPSLKYQCLLVLDEFTSMGRVNIIQESVAFTAGYNMRYMFILQDKSQLENKENYGKEGAETLIANCAVQLVYPPKEVNSHIKGVSESIGYYDFATKTVNKTKGKSSSSSHGETINKRAVLLPQEIVDLREIKHKSGISTREIVMSEFSKALLADKIIYFDEPFFQEKKEFSEKNVPEIPVLNVEKNHIINTMVKGV